MTSPTKHLEIFDEKLQNIEFLHGVPVDLPREKHNELKQHLIQTVISVLEGEIREATYNKLNYCKEDIFLEKGKPYDWHGYHHASTDIINSLTTTLSTWKALL